MMYAARSLMSWSVRAVFPPLGGLAICFGSPGCGVRPLVMMVIRKVGSSTLETPGSLSIGFKTAPMPPSRLAPWQVAQFWPYRVAPLAGSPGSAAAAVPDGDGDGELSASVVIAVKATRTGTASATSAESLKPFGRRIARQIITTSILGPRRE